MNDDFMTFEGSVRSILNSEIKICSNFLTDNFSSTKFINNFVFMKKDRTDSYFFSSETRENALLELSRKRESVESLAPMLWHSFGTISGIDFQIHRPGQSLIARQNQYDMADIFENHI